jgi:hypothetical protein
MLSSQRIYLPFDDNFFIFTKVENVLSYNMPTGGGFSAGLFMGLRN